MYVSGEDGCSAVIASAASIQVLSLTPLVCWVAYSITFSGDASVDGLWVAPTAGGLPHRLADFGTFAWRAEGRLLLIPLESTAPSNRLIEVDASDGAERTLTDPAITPFQIAQGNWSLSPDGARLAFV